VHWLPMWLDEGMAEFYSYTRFQDDHITLGAPTIRYRHLRNETPIPVTQMLAMNQKTLGKDVRRGDLFYGEAWAMVHYMMFGQDMGNGAKLNTFIASLEKGTPQVQAFQEIFGDAKAFDEKLATYLSRFLIAGAIFPEAQKVDPKSFPARVLTAAEANYEIGCFDVGIHDTATARKRLETAEAGDSSLGGPHEELGFMAWRQGQDEEAKAEWRKAVAADPGLYRSAFALLMSGKPLREQTEQELETTRLALEAIKTKAPRFAPVTVELALIEWRQKNMKKAFQDAVTAQTLEPWRAGYRLLAGNILLQGGQPKVAADYARAVADRWPGSDHDEAVDLWNMVPANMRGGGPALKFEIPTNAMVARGTIVSSSCGKDGVSLSLQPSTPNSAVLQFVDERGFESGFSDTLWFGEDHYTPCFHIAGLPAVVAYEPAGEGTQKLLALEVRDDLPELKVRAGAPPAAAPKPAVQP